MKGKAVKDKKREKKQVIKNYIALVALFIVCMGIVLYICELYKVNDEEKKKIPVISGVLSEIYSEDLEHYLMDNPTAVIYMCAANDENCRTFERDFKKLLRQREYNDQIVYLNLTDLDQDEFVEEFNDKYHYKIKLTTKYPAFVLFEDGEVVTVLQGNEKKALKVSNVKQFLELYEIGE